MSNSERISLQGWAPWDGSSKETLDRLSVPFEPKPPVGWAMGPTYIDPRACALRISARRPMEVHLILGSQSAPLRDVCDDDALLVDIDAGKAILVNPRVWRRIPDTSAAVLDIVRLPAPVIETGFEPMDLVSWRRKGYGWLRGVLPQPKVADLKSALETALAKDIDTWGESRLKEIGQYGALRNLCNLDKKFLDLLGDSPALAFIDQILRPGYVLQAFDGLTLSPGEGRFPWDFHTDLDPLVGIELTKNRVVAVNILYFLETTRVENGATWLVPHSHFSALLHPEPQLLSALALAAEGEPGDVLVFDSRLWHCAGNNTSTSKRSLIKTQFCEPWIRPAMDYRRALSNELWEMASPRAKQLLGEYASPPVTVSEFRERVTRSRTT